MDRLMPSLTPAAQPISHTGETGASTSAAPWRYTVLSAPTGPSGPGPAAGDTVVVRPQDPAHPPVQDVLDTLQVDPSRGLSMDEAARRLQQFGRNELATAHSTSALGRFIAQFSNPLSLLLLPAGVIAAVTGEVPDAVGIGVASLLNAAIGYAQETRAEKSMEALAALSVREAVVVRDGQHHTIPAAEVVPGDVLHLSQGEVVPADARLLHAHSLSTDEAALTGEAKPVNKDANHSVAAHAPPHEQKNMVFSGSGIKSGAAEAVVTSTGLATQLGDIADKTAKAAPPPTPLDRDLKKLANQMMGLGGVSSVLVGTATGFATGSPLIGLGTAISTLVAVVPESLPTVTTLTLASGVQEARSRNVLIRNLSSVETLGSTTVICTDKTGTLTTGEMVGRKVWAQSPEQEKMTLLGAMLGSTASKEGPTWKGAPTEIALSKYLEGLPGLTVTRPDAQEPNRVTVRFSDQVSHDLHLTPEEMADVAPLIAGGKSSEALARLDEVVRARTTDHPFGSDRKMHTVTVPGAMVGEQGFVSFTSGALDRILPRTSLSEAEKQAIMHQNDELAQKGFRVLALAHKKSDTNDDTQTVESNLTFSGLVAIQDPLRDGVRDSVTELHGAGIRVAVITGDQMLTARSIAEEAGILDPARSRCVLSDDQLAGVDVATPQGRATVQALVDQAAQAEQVVMSGRWMDLFAEKEPAAGTRAPFSYDTFKGLVDHLCVAYRVEPRHKIRLVQTMQDQGETVAMTGDGVNDAPAIKAADIGIAMGIRGTEVTKEAAHMILTDDSFNSIASGVKVGRLIHSNMRKAVNYTISSNLGEVLGVGLTSVAGLALGAALPPMLCPLQLLWINLVTDSLPALALAKEPAEGELMKEAPRAKESGLLTRDGMARMAAVGGLMGVTAAGLYMLHPIAGVAANVASTMAFNYLVTSQAVNAVASRKEGNASVLGTLGENKMMMATVAGTIALQAALPFIPGLGPALRVATLTLPQWALVGGLSAAVIPAAHLVKKMFKSHGDDKKA